MFCLSFYLRFVAVLSVIANFVLHQCIYEHGEDISEPELGQFSSLDDHSGSFESGFLNVSDHCTNAITRHTIDWYDPGIVPSQATGHHAKSPVSIDRIKYTRNELLELRHGQHKVSPDVLETIKAIPKRKCTRGHRGGKHIRRIPVYTSERNTHNNSENRHVDFTNLRYVPMSNNNTINNEGSDQVSYNFPSIYLCNPRSLNNKMDEFRTIESSRVLD